MIKEEFDSLQNPDKSSLYTLIRRNEDGTLRVVWYHDAYASKIKKAADLLKQAVALAEDAGFKKYLELRSEGPTSINTRKVILPGWI